MKVGLVKKSKAEVGVDTSLHWQQRVGNQRDWVWRGWQTRYTYLRSAHPLEHETPLILLHGFGASIGHWRHNLVELAEHHSVYALDMLGFGASEKAIAHYDAMLWVEQVYDFWRTFIRKPVVLVGNSIGSLVSLAVAATYPDMVQGVVMISLPDPSVREEAIPAFIRPLVTSLEGFFTSPWLLRAFFPIVRRPEVVRPWAAIAYANAQAVTDELVEILAGPAQDRGSAQAFCTILKAMTSSKFGPRVKTVLQTLDMPLLLIWGKEDRMIPKQLARPSQYLSYNAKLKLVELEDAGHCPHDECPERVNQEILEWMASWRSSLALDMGTPCLPSLSLNEKSLSS